MVRKNILTEIDLEIVDGLLHDSVLEPKDIKYDKYSKNLGLFFYRIAAEEKWRIEKKKFFFVFTILKYPIAKSLLHLENLKYLDIYPMETDEKKFYLDGIEKEGNSFTMLFTPDLEIRFSFKDKIKGYLEDIKMFSPSEAKYKYWELTFFDLIILMK